MQRKQSARTGSRLTAGGSACLLLALLGCATVVSDSHQMVSFDSSPPGSRVHIASFDGKQHYTLTTPSMIPLKRSQRYLAEFELDGFYTQTLPVVSSAGGAAIGSALGNVALVGPLAPALMVVDHASGAIYSYPEQVKISLTPLATDAPPNALTYQQALDKIQIAVEATLAKQKSRAGRPGNPKYKPQVPAATNIAACDVFQCSSSGVAIGLDVPPGLESKPRKCKLPRGQRRKCKTPYGHREN